MTIGGWEMDRRRIEVDSHTISYENHSVPLGEFFDQLANFTSKFGDCDNVEIFITSYQTQTMIEAFRWETDDEYSSRMDEIKARELAIKREADTSWKRQQRKFQRARARKDAKLRSQQAQND